MSSSLPKEGRGEASGPGAGRPASGFTRAKAVGPRRAALILLFLVCACACLSGCDPLVRHKIATTIFDGVPSMPPAEQYCSDYHQQALLDEAAAAKKRTLAKLGTATSEHPPYAEKRCSGCHDKNSESGFVVPLAGLCAHCHKDFPQGDFIHGPAAVGACLKCHLPHKSDHPSLLVLSKSEVCIACHTEPRVAAAMHAKVTANGMFCSDCHDPHSGGNHFFLR